MTVKSIGLQKKGQVFCFKKQNEVLSVGNGVIKDCNLSKKCILELLADS